MSSVISILLSLIMLIFPFLNFLAPKSIPDRLSIVTLTENGSDIVPVDENGEEIDEAYFSADSTEEEDLSLPSAYDSRDYGLVTPAKVQGNTGCCWAFAAISAAETSMIKQGLADNTVDYSEAHLTWFGLRSISDSPWDTARGDGIYSESPFSDGGNWARSLFALARWSGVQTEENVPFDGFPYPAGNYPENQRYESYAHLQNSRYFEASDRDGIKQAILDCGSIAVSYYHTNTFYNISPSGGACYYQRSVKNTNHTVAVVGWDDNYSKDSFKKTPEGDGAWLVKNSWGSSWGDNGYLWLSYYDTSLSYFVTYEMESADNYENINQYDGFGYKGWGYLAGYNTMSMANVFTTKSAETVKAVSFYTVQPDVSYTVEIYTDVTNGGYPTDGTLVTSESGYMEYRGYKTVRLSEPVSLPKGARYSAVVTINVPEGTDACIPLEFPEGFDGAHERSYYAESGQSYLTTSRDWDEWTDTADSGYNNVCIKTFSDNDSLRLKYTSEYKSSDGVLGFVEPGTDENFILSQFKNLENTDISDGFVYLYGKNGEILDSLEIAYLGDIDNDGDLDYDDYNILRSFVSFSVEPTPRERFSSDIDRNRRVTLDDLAALGKYLYSGGTL